MIELPVVTVIADEGVVENVRMWVEEPSGPPIEELRGIKDVGGIKDQLTLARQIATFFLSRPYVIPATVSTLNGGTLVAEFESGTSYRGRSFGLAFLTGCLALGFHVSVRKRQLLSASLEGLLNQPGWAGGGSSLDTVAGIGGKVAVACVDQRSRLYLYSGDEKAMLSFEQAFWGGEID